MKKNVLLSTSLKFWFINKIKLLQKLYWFDILT